MNSKKLRNRKIFLLAFLMIATGILITFLPSLARINNRNSIDTKTVWDGTVGSSYRKGSGTKSDPYIIASGKELSYFSQMLKNTSYDGKYFALSNDIILNNGIFSYEDSPKYTLNKSEFYLKPGSVDFYDNAEYSGDKIGSVNTIESLNNFKGHFDGNSYTIYGLYIHQDKESGLFTNLSGTVENLYVTNTLIAGSEVTGGIASSATNATIKNVLFNGNVVGNREIKKDTETLIVDNIVSQENGELLITLPSRQKIGSITSASLKGNCESDFIYNDKTVTCTNSSFEITLNNNYQNTLTLLANDPLTNITLNLNYNIAYTGGIVGVGDNVTLENVINKASVKSSDTAGGLIAYITNHFEILRSYNMGSLQTCENYSGLVGTIKDLKENSTISYSYNNTGNHAGFVGNVYNSSDFLSIENSFEAGKNYAFIKKIEDSVVTFNNVYSIGTNEFKPTDVRGSVTNIPLDSLKNKDFMTTSLAFNEFISPEDLNTSPNNSWIYEDGYLPTLYIDDLQDPIASLHVGTYTWNNLGFDDQNIYYQSKVAFQIEENSAVKPIKEAYYYIHKAATFLTKQDLENLTWTPYENTTYLEENGAYIIYAKVLDYNNHLSYISSNKIIIDSIGSDVKVLLGDHSWNTLKDDLSYTYIDSASLITIEATDDLSGIKKIEYLTSPTPLTQSDLENAEFETYGEHISFDSLGSKIIYVKVMDNSGNVTLVNTDYIVYDGYTLTSMKIGNNDTLKDMTDHSQVTYRFTYNDTNKINDGHAHYLASNIPLKDGTKITLKNNKTKKVYTYKVGEEKDAIPFTDFKEVGKGNMDVYFEEILEDAVDEDFEIELDLKDTSLNNGINGLEVYIELHDQDGNVSRSTIKNTLKSINIHKNMEAEPFIRTNDTDKELILNKDSTEAIDLQLGINYQTNNSNTIYDSTFDDQQMGIQIKLLDKDDNTVKKQDLKNIAFKYLNNYYSPNNDGITRIKLEQSDLSNQTLYILTNASTSNLKDGTYYLNISSIVSLDGLYGGVESKESLNIPVIVKSANESPKYNFNIQEFEDSHVLNRKDKTKNIEFQLESTDNLIDPRIRISLYQKDKLTAYDQSYKIIDLIDYTTDSLESIIENVYLANIDPITNKFSLNLDLKNFKPTGYKIVLTLYDSNKFIGSLEKKFIVR